MNTTPRSLTPIALALYALALVGVSLLPAQGAAPEARFTLDLDPRVTNLLHIPAFALFTLLLLATGWWQRRSRRVRLGLVLAVGVAFGTGLELVQATVPGRMADLMDLGLNSLGCIGGILLAMWLGERKKRHLPHARSGTR